MIFDEMVNDCLIQNIEIQFLLHWLSHKSITITFTVAKCFVPTSEMMNEI